MLQGTRHYYYYYYNYYKLHTLADMAVLGGHPQASYGEILSGHPVSKVAQVSVHEWLS